MDSDSQGTSEADGKDGTGTWTADEVQPGNVGGEKRLEAESEKGLEVERVGGP